jgi:VCBS repeat-containing protein
MIRKFSLPIFVSLFLGFAAHADDLILFEDFGSVAHDVSVADHCDGCKVFDIKSSSGDVGTVGATMSGTKLALTSQPDSYGIETFEIIGDEKVTFYVTVTVKPVNDAPVITSISNQTTNEDTPLTKIEFELDEDNQGDIANENIQVLLVTAESSDQTLVPNGNITVNFTDDGNDAPPGNLDITPAANRSGVTTITVTVNDQMPLNNKVVETFTVTVKSINDAPTVLTNAGSTVLEGGTDVIRSAELAGTDVDDFDPTLVFTVSAVTNGQIEVSGVPSSTFTQNDINNWDVTFVHDDSEDATASFDFSIADGGEDGASPATGTFTINVNPVNDNAPVAVDDAISVAEGGTATVLTTAETSVIRNDTDADLPDDSLGSATVITDTSQGALTLNANGTFSYTHNGTENFSDSFTYTIDDANSATSNTATVSITVTPVNDNTPVVVADAYTLAEGGSLSETAGLAGTGVLGNDSDDDLPGDTLTVNLVTDVTQGSLTLNTDGSFTYDHDGSENFTDSFTYSVFDGVNTSATQTVSITITPVNDNFPVVVADAYTVAEGGSLSETGGLAGTGVLGNDSDADLPANTLTVSLGSGTTQGALTLNTDGSFTYDHNGSENLADSFTYTVFDGANTSAVQTATITVTPVNDNIPVVVADAYTVAEGGSLSETAGLAGTGVLGNDSDADMPGDTLTVNLVTDVTQGSLTLNTDGSFTYGHNDSENFTDSFTYSVFDGANTSATQTVSITITPVNDNIPVVVADAYTVAEGGSLSETAGLAGTGVLGNDSDADLPGDTFTVNLVTDVTQGSLTLNTDGSFTYDHNDSENFTDSFTYSVFDGANTSATQTVSITITPVNDNIPVVVADAYTVAEGGSLSETAGLAGTGVLGNDSDADLPGDTFTVNLVTDVTQGSLTDGSFTYAHNDSENFTDSFTYSVFDGANTSATQTVSITITPANDNTPVVVADAYTVAEGGSLSETAGLAGTGVLGNDSDADMPGDTLTVSVVTDVTQGALTLNADGSFTYAHNDSERRQFHIRP